MLSSPVTVHVAGLELGHLNHRVRCTVRRTIAISMVPQPADNLLLALTGRENLVIAGRQRGVQGDLAAKADEVLERMQLQAFADQPCSQMSGGEQQRIALAACLLSDAVVILADEPSGALDRAGAATIVDALATAAAAGATIVVATHDPNIVAAASTVIRLDHGRRVQ